MVSSRILDDKALVASDARKHSRLFNSPLSNIGPVLVGFGVLLLGVRRSPPRLPVVGELLEERGFEVGGLGNVSAVRLLRLAAYCEGRSFGRTRG